MKKMICYFLACAAILALIAGCVTDKPGESTPNVQGSVPSQNVQNTQTQNSQGGQNPNFTVPTYELETLPTIDREPVGSLPGVDPEQELYIMTGKNDIIYANRWKNNFYSFRIYSKQPLDVNSISVKVPISSYYSVKVSQRELDGIKELDVGVRMDERYYRSEDFTYPIYLAYRGKDFRKLLELKTKFEQLRKLTSEYDDMCYIEKVITEEEYKQLMQPYWDAKQEYEDYLNAEWEDYLALTEADLPQFYAYNVFISFDNLGDLGATLEKEESFTQIEVTIGDETYVQDIGKVTLIEDWELPAPLDWKITSNPLAGIHGSTNGPRPYNDGIHYINTYYHFVAGYYKLLEELVMLNPAQTIDRVWLKIKPAGGKWFVEEWDMSEPYEIYPGDEVIVYATYRDENLETLGYKTMTDAYLLYTTDGEQYCKISHCSTYGEGSDYFWNAVLFDGIDFESYYWDYYFPIYEPWRLDPEEDPSWYD